MPQDQNKDLLLEDVQLLFRNFGGHAKDFNSEGDRNFHVILNPKQAKEMLAAGWRVKQLKPRDDDEGGEGDYHLKVTLNYKKGRPPRVVMVSSQGRNELGAEEVGLLDVADIQKCDLMVNGWYSDMAGGGYSAYLKTLFATIREDELELRYAFMPDTVDSAPREDNWVGTGTVA